MQEVCAALVGTPLAQAVSKLTLFDLQVEAQAMAALCASFPNVLHFELNDCPQNMASSFSEAIVVWPMLRSVLLASWSVCRLQAAQQHLGAAAPRPGSIIICARFGSSAAALGSSGTHSSGAEGRAAVCDCAAGLLLLR